MPVPAAFADRLTLPAVVAPMFLVSGPDLVVESCAQGLVGTFPALNPRTGEALDAWLSDIELRLSKRPHAAPFGVNLIVHKTNSRLRPDLDRLVRHKVPLVITSLGAVPDVVDAVHSYGGIVFHDVISVRHAEKAIQAGVDGIVAVCAGAGGHAGTLSPFALVPEIRAIFDGTILLSGAISTGAHILAARALGADLAYLGTRFLVTRESMAPDAQKEMTRNSRAADIVYTDAISGVNANFLRPSIVAHGLDPENLPPGGKMDMETEARAWKDVWSAGQGVGSIHDIPTAAELCRHLIGEYRHALDELARPAFDQNLSV